MEHEHCPCGTVIVISDGGSPVKCSCGRMYELEIGYIDGVKMWWDDLPLWKKVILRTLIWLVGFYTVLLIVLSMIVR